MRCLRAHSTNPALTGPLALTALMALIALPLARPAGAGEVPFGVQPAIYADGWGADSVFAADVDGDGDLDVLSASALDHEIAWYENTDGTGSFGAQQVISTASNEPYSVFAADVDGDGNLDVLSASASDDEIAWYRNTDGAGSFGSRQMISTAANGAVSVFAADVDGDGDLDVLSASRSDSKVAWYQNTDGSGSFGAQQIISTAAAYARSVFAADVDGDGDLDVLSASNGDNKIAWYRNTDGAGSFGAQQVISTAADSPYSVFAADVDGDGDLDVLSASNGDDKIAWYENTNGSGSFGAQQVISTAAAKPLFVFAADVDGDGDVDALSGSAIDDEIAWYENTDGAGDFGAQHTISTSGQGGINSVLAVDVDGDGDTDVLFGSGSDTPGWIAWHENQTIHRSASFPAQSVISTVADGAFGVFAADVDGDGDLDALSASWWDDKIAWYGNTNGAGAFGAQQVITTAAATPRSVFAADVDGDGDVDALSASQNDDTIAWYENTDGGGTFGAPQVISTAADSAKWVFAADVDGDGDLDALSASHSDNKVAWYENDGTPGGLGDWTARTISSAAGGAVEVIAADVDGDGDLDALSASWVDDKIAWYENTDGGGTFGGQQVISTAADVESVFAADVDGDGDLDALSASPGDDTIAWYENTDGGGTFGGQQVITTAADGAYSVFAADVDGDGDTDVLSASYEGDEITWYESDGASSPAWAVHTISGLADQADSVFAADVDGDGDLDVLSASNADDKIAWYENRGGQFALATANTAPLALADGSSDDLLRIDVIHNGRAGDTDLELAALELRFEDELGSPLSSAQANALIADLEIYLDEGSGFFEGAAETLVTTVSTLALTDGRQSVTFTDGDPNVQLATTASRSYFVVPVLASEASTQTPSRFRILHLPESGSAAEDRDHDIPLSLEAAADTASGVLSPFSPDSDGDGLTDAEEASLGTSSSLEDTDGDGLLDGEEVNLFGYEPISTDDSAADFDSDGLTDVDELTVHGTNALDADTDGDGVDDGTEVGGATEPLDSSVPFVSHSIAAGLNAPAFDSQVDIDGDGDIDLVSTLAGDDQVVWYENTAADGSVWVQYPLVTAIGIQEMRLVVDIDTDGDPDLIVPSTSGGVRWYENAQVYGSPWSSTQIRSSPTGGVFLNAADIDRDGDPDVVTASADPWAVTWYENDGSGGTWTAHTVASTPLETQFISIADVDRDGDLDLVATVVYKIPTIEGPVTWYENASGDGLSWIPHLLTGTIPGPNLGGLTELDGDGDLDVVLSPLDLDRIYWLEQVSGDGSTFRARIVSRDSDGGGFPFASDLDWDGDADLIVNSSTDGSVSWYENTSGDASTWVRRRIETGLADPRLGWPVDIDGDGDLDLFRADPVAGTLGWYENLTIHSSVTFPARTTITTATDWVSSLFAADVDADGDLDVLSASRLDDEIAWYENTDGAGSFGTQQIISVAADEASSVFAADVDGDGDLDVLSASVDDDEIAWYENTDGAGSFGAQQIISTAGDAASFVLAADVDGDGDLDVLSSSTADDEIAWYQNSDGAGSFGAQQIISTAADTPRSIFVADVDGDADLDVLSASSFDDTIAWYENTDGEGSFGPQQVISVQADFAVSVLAADLDGDGDLDVASGSYNDDEIAWYENTDGAGSFGSQQVVTTTLNGVQTLFAADLDRDGDLDLLSASANDGEIVWYQNTDGAGTFGTEQLISTVADGPLIVAVDLDGDGDLDLLSARPDTDTIAWYPNRGGQFALPTSSTAYLGMVDGQLREVLEIEAIHRGRSGDTDLELATLELLLDDGGDTPLLDAQADALFTQLAVYLDDGSTSFEVGSDTHVGSTSAPFTLAGGTLAVSFADADLDVQVAQGTPRTYFVVATLQGSASSASPNQFQVTHQTESSSTAEDRDHDLPLSLEYHADTSSGSILALSTTGDADSDGLQNSVEAISHDTDPANPDTDGDGLNDGDEVGTHLTDPLDPDMDDDGLDDGEEIALGTSPTDPDEDDDTICDGGATVGGTCSAGPDNCPFIDNGTQTNSDAFPAGDACQCGDLDDDGTVEADDATLARQHLMGKTVSADLTRCNVTGPSDGGISDCDVADIFVLQRVAAGRPVTLENTCRGYTGP